MQLSGGFWGPVDYNYKRSAAPAQSGAALAVSWPPSLPAWSYRGLLLVRWYMSSLCAPYCVNRIFMIYTVGPGSLPSLSRFFFLPSPANRLAAVPFDITRHCDITIFATSLWRTHNWTLFNPGNPERLWAICTYTLYVIIN